MPEVYKTLHNGRDCCFQCWPLGGGGNSGRSFASEMVLMLIVILVGAYIIILLCTVNKESKGEEQIGALTTPDPSIVDVTENKQHEADKDQRDSPNGTTTMKAENVTKQQKPENMTVSPHHRHQHHLNHKVNSSSSSSEENEPEAILVEAAHSDYYSGKETLAAELSRHVRVFCWIATSPNNHQTRAIHVARTWARRCNTFVFVSSQNDTSLPAIDLLGNMTDNRAHLWAKTKAGFRYAYEHHFDDNDWFLKADDDTYVVVENLRQFLRDKNADKEALYFGHRFAPLVKQGYMGGGAGYVLSKLALQKLVLNGINEKENPESGLKGVCNLGDGPFEDVELGACIEKLNIQPGDSRDTQGRHRFLPFGPLSHFGPQIVGPECCSNSVISFHYVDPTMMQFLDYAFYAVKPFGHEYETSSTSSMNTTTTIV